jgi:heat shock protein HslJ
MGSHLGRAFHGVLAASLALTLLAGETQAQELSAPQKGAPAPVLSPEGEFVASELNGAKLSGLGQAKKPRLMFLDQNRIAGFSGCRAFEGQLVYGQDGSTEIRITKLEKVRCSPVSARVNARMMASLKASGRLDMKGGALQLVGSRNQILGRFDAISPRPDHGPSLYGRTWVLTQINGTSPPKNDPKPTLVFTGASINGSTGCNQFSGTHTRQAGKSAFVITAQTQRACLAPEGDPMALEANYLTALASVDRIDLTPTTLTLSATNVETLLVFSLEP